MQSSSVLVMIVGASVGLVFSHGQTLPAPDADVSLLQKSLEIDSQEDQDSRSVNNSSWSAMLIDASEQDQMVQPLEPGDWRHDLGIIKAAALIAHHVYYFTETVDVVHGGSTVQYRKAVEFLQTSAVDAFTNDRFAVYTREGGSECFLAISGSDDVSDIVDDLHVFPENSSGVPVCGLYNDMSPGFANEYNDFARPREEGGTRPVEFDEILASNTCQDIYITGHSLGGAVGSILAACVQNTNIWPWKDKFRALYTFGAPSVKYGDWLAGPNDACFPGIRFYNMDDMTQDPVPAAGAVISLNHPKMASVRIRSHCCGIMCTSTCSYYTQYFYGCDSFESRYRPILEKSPSPFDHGTMEYANRFSADLNGERRRRRRWR